MSIKPRLTLVTLGVSDFDRAKRFYQALGWRPSSASQDNVAFFDLNGVALSLYPRHLLAQDAKVEDSAPGFSGVTLAHNVESEAEADQVFAHALACGATEVKKPEKVFWGGYSGYFSDPDGHLWEVAHNPFFPFDDKGHMQLPS